MEDRQERPRAGAGPPVTAGAGPELLQHLLECELRRLDVAVAIEAKRGIVFPETSIIVRDILRIRQAMDAGSVAPQSSAATEEDEIAAALARLDVSG